LLARVNQEQMLCALEQCVNEVAMDGMNDDDRLPQRRNVKGYS